MSVDPQPAILVVDDEETFLSGARRMLRAAGFEDVTTVAQPGAVAALVEQRPFVVAFLDINLPGTDGLTLLQRIKELSPATVCIMLTADGAVPTVVRAMRLGAFDYLVKPVTPEQVRTALDRALEHRSLVDVLFLRSRAAAADGLDTPAAFADLVTCDEGLLRLLHEAELHARSDIPVLVTGETGVGKEVLARAVHRASRRAERPFVAVNMLALSPSLFESEFFGHARGAFTGAVGEKTGYLGQARGGTLFLDEIGDLSLEVQGKLLRILQEGEYTPVGRTQPVRADCRFVAATNQDLEARVADGRFRKDLFYRLRFARLHVPALRDRPDDVHLLAQRFLRASSRPGARFGDDALAALVAHDWPGNVRELKGVVEAAANLAEEGTIGAAHLALVDAGSPAPGAGGVGDLPPAATAGGGAPAPLCEVERRHILAVYEAAARNKTQAARLLGIGLQTLHRKLRAYGVR